MKRRLIKVTSQPIVKWATRSALVGRTRCRQQPEKGRFSRAEVDDLLEQSWLKFQDLMPDVPQESTFSNTISAQALTFSFFQVLVARGIERAYAIELVADTTWKVLEKWGRLTYFIAGLFARDPTQRMRTSVNMILRFPFNPPGFVFERLPADDGISLDMHRCPVAIYFYEQDATDLCVGSWCNLDFALAEMWGGRLERSGTLAAGCDRCDFRFKAKRHE